jgi:hypothetical protein
MMKSPLRVVLLTIALLVSMMLAAQITKTGTGKAKTKTDTSKMKNNANKVQLDSVAITPAIEGSGGTGTTAAPYTATYSSQFTIGNAQHSDMVLRMWKDWDDNQIDRSAAMIADTMMMEMPNGMMVRGKDSFLMAAKEYRGQYTTVKSTLEAIMPLHSTDRQEDWVAIWGVEESTNKDGTLTRNRLHEIWRINKDGKIDFMRQFAVLLPTR